MLAVAIFALGVITLGRCVSNCLAAEQYKVEDVRARRALENRVAEIESGAVSIKDSLVENLKDLFVGLKLEQSTREAKKFNEKKEELIGLTIVTLRVSWLSGRDPQSRELIFYVQAREL